MFDLLESKASRLKPEKAGCWRLTGGTNRSILVDADLTGTILGLTLTTKPEAISAV